MKILLIIYQLVHFDFRQGDILFQDCDCGPMCDAIEEVTLSPGSRRYSHIAIVVDSSHVVEANSSGVKRIQIDSFIHRYHDQNGRPKISIGRLKNKYNYLINNAVSYANSKVSIGYDTLFMMNNGLYYCSELIYEAFKFANGNRDFFKLQPMQFIDRKTKKFHPGFIDYYRKMNRQIPEGQPGINPVRIRLDNRLRIYHLYKRDD